MKRTDLNQERREAKRFQVSWDLSVSGKDRRGKRFNEAGSLLNLSSRGAFFYLPLRVKLGATLNFDVRVPMKKTWMTYSAEVVRVEPGDDRFGIAVMFDTARPAFFER